MIILYIFLALLGLTVIVIVIDGICYVCFAVGTKHGVRGGIARTDDFEKFDII